ncbi:MAG: trimeric intracellular cation channel family protein [Victivallaceae bacterium]|nr:trimeric intracellular cation channel family protein [Victivallaceae bacterium]
MDQLITIFDLFGTAVFAVTGAVRGVKAKFDLLGVVVLSCAVGVGGGMMRDAIIGATPAAALTSESYLILCIAAGVTVFFMSGKIMDSRHIITVCDAVGLGVFTVLGAAKGVNYDLAPVGVVLTGTLTAVGGGMLRDVLVGTVPEVLRRDFYATASLIGGVVYLFLIDTGLPHYANFLIVSFLVTAIRLTAFHYKIQLPRAGAAAARPE